MGEFSLMNKERVRLKKLDNFFKIELLITLASFFFKLVVFEKSLIIAINYLL